MQQQILLAGATAGPSYLYQGTITVGSSGTLRGFSTPFAMGSHTDTSGGTLTNLFYDTAGGTNLRAQWSSALAGDPATLNVTVNGINYTFTGGGAGLYQAAATDVWNLAGSVGLTFSVVAY